MTWETPRAGATRADAFFGPKSLSDWLPTWNAIPDEFKRDSNRWCALVSRWFFEGLPEGYLIAKPGIVYGDAIAHVSAILRSFEPKHEHKEAGAGYLMSLWFEEPKS